MEKIRDIYATHQDIIIMIDGCSRRNPGRSGAGICFFGRPKQNNHETLLPASP